MPLPFESPETMAYLSPTRSVSLREAARAGLSPFFRVPLPILFLGVPKVVDFPDNVIAIVKEICKKYGCDIRKSTDASVKKIQALPNYHQLIDSLVYNAVRQLVYDQREAFNSEIRSRKEYGAYAGKPSGAAASINQIHKSINDYYEYKIGGTNLGDLLGEELIPLAESCEETANGHLFNAKILRDLRPFVNDGCTVRESVKPRKIKSIFDGIQAA